MLHCHRRRRVSSRAGMVLVVVLVAIMLLSLAGYTFAQLMFAEREAAWAHGRNLQARALAQSGVALIEQQLAQTSASLQQQGGWYNNPGLYRGVLAADGVLSLEPGRFTVLSPSTQQGEFIGVRYGLEDESGRLNLNTLLLADQQSSGSQSSGSGSSGSASSGSASSGSASSMLMMLPGMTQDIADAILDWMDPDDTPRQYGAERDYYSSLTPSYAPKNGPMESVEELLLVRGVTPQLLFGMDIDRNWMVDSREMSGQFTQGGAAAGGAGTGGAGTGGGMSSSNMQSSNSQSGGSSISSADASSAASYGWAAYLTVHSMESNLRPDGQLKINVNESDLSLLYEELSGVFDSDQAAFIVAYRQGQVVQTTQQGSPINGRTPDLTKSGSTQLASPLDLVGAKVQITFSGDNSATTLDSPFASTPSAMAGYIPNLLNYLTIVPAATAPGRININQASRPVLLMIPNIDAQTVDRILSTRPADPSQANVSQQYPTWLYEENLVDLNMMKQIMPYVTASGRVYRAQVVGFFDRPGPVCRIEAVVDATTPIPRLVFWRELTHLGRGYSPAMLGISSP